MTLPCVCPNFYFYMLLIMEVDYQLDTDRLRQFEDQPNSTQLHLAYFTQILHTYTQRANDILNTAASYRKG